MIRSIATVAGALVAIMVTVIAGTVLATAVLAGPDNALTTGYLAANLAVSFAAAAFGGFLVVRFAQRRPISHALVLAALLAIMTLPSLGQPAPGQPAWYPGVILLTGITGVLCGAFISMRRSAHLTPEKQPA